MPYGDYCNDNPLLRLEYWTRISNAADLQRYSLGMTVDLLFKKINERKYAADFCVYENSILWSIHFMVFIKWQRKPIKIESKLIKIFDDTQFKQNYIVSSVKMSNAGIEYKHWTIICYKSKIIITFN